MCPPFFHPKGEKEETYGNPKNHGIHEDETSARKLHLEGYQRKINKQVVPYDARVTT
jgi:hypothetical protein